jgi:DNA-binding response OmpR family regulator
MTSPEFKRRIMVVDDDPDIRLILEAALSEKYEVVHAHDGLDALEKLERFEPDFIVMDMVMPLMSGLEACVSIRRNPHFQNVQVMFLSAHTTREDIAKSYASGGNLFLAKPIDPERLVRNVDVFFEKYRTPPQPKRMTILQIKMLEKGDNEAIATGPAPHIPRRAMAPQVGERPRGLLERRPTPPGSVEREAVPEEPVVAPRPGSVGLLVPRILIVEDDKDLSDLMRLALSEIYEVVMAHDGLEAVEKIVKYQPDVLVIDVMLPRMNGYQLCQSVRANHVYAKVPIVFVTAKSTTRDREHAMKIGGTKFLAKPFEMEDLLEICREVTAAPGFRISPKSLSTTEIRAAERQTSRTQSTPSATPPAAGPFAKTNRLG